MRNNSLTLVMLLSTLSILVAINSLPLVYAQEEKMAESKMPMFFAIQHANSGTISEINATVYSLELNGVSDKTILFSDRPNRIVMSESTSDFIRNWSAGTDNFVVDMPNAVLVVDEKDRQQDIAIIELFNPIYDSDKKTLNYKITPDNATFIELPRDLGQTTIVIDAVLNCQQEGGLL